MTTETTTRKFRCPKCGHKHAADLSRMEGHPEIHGKVPCAECHTLLWISLNDDGSTEVEIYEKHLHEVYEKKAEHAVEAAIAQAQAQVAPGAATPAGGAGGWIGPVLAAAVVAAVVSLALGTSGKKKDDTPAGPPAGAVAASDLTSLGEDLRAEMATAAGAAEQARADLAQGITELQAALARATEAHVPGAGADPDAAAALQALTAKVEKALANYQELNGRIEANYTNLRLALKRLEALEGR